MLIIRDTKSTSKVFISKESDGSKADQRKKLTGVIINAAKDENAVSVTDNATWPRASWVKKLDTLPPGQQATNSIPNAMPVGIGKQAIMITVSRGNKMNWENKPVATAFF